MPGRSTRWSCGQPRPGHDAFAHKLSLVRQFYGENDFEAYRHLGYGHSHDLVKAMTEYGFPPLIPANVELGDS